MANAQLSRVLQHLRSLGETQLLAEACDAQLLELFISQQDEPAFAALLRRHGPMVLSVSQRVLHRLQDAEDVFQATFLLLARKAASIRKRESVSCWLHGVAHRLAIRAKTQGARRQAHEKRAADMRTQRSSSEVTWPEAQMALDAALEELPEKYRTALVLCYLEGKSHAEAAQLLSCPLATVRTRVARGRTLLRNRLTSRGLTLSTAGLVALLLASAAPAAAPAALVKATLNAALPFAAGQTTAALCSASVAGLVEGGLRTMFLTKVKTALTLLLLLTVLAGAGAWAQRRVAVDEGATPQTAVEVKMPVAIAIPLPAKKADEGKDRLTYSGRVLGPDGRPVAGAKLYLTPAVTLHNRRSSASEYATTGPDGRFKFTIPTAKVADQFTFITATAANHGVAWVTVAPAGPKDDLTLRLVEDDVPITGQIVDLEGKPVPGATLTVLVVTAAPGEDLGPWLEAVKATKDRAQRMWREVRGHLRPFNIPRSPQVTTDAQGRFRLLSGIGRNRFLRAQLDGPGIASQYLEILTRPGKPIEVTESKGNIGVTTYYGSDFRHAAAPTKPVVGVVRDKDTRKPLAGVTIQSNQLANNPVPGMDIVQTATDAQGRYRLTGMPKGEGNKIRLVPRDDQPYVSVHALVPDSPGLDPVTVDFELKPGAWIEGKLTDKATGKPVQGYVAYVALHDNPNLRDHPGFDGTIPPYWGVATKADGSYRIVGLPGPGLVAVHYDGHHLPAPERDDEYGTRESTLYTSPSLPGLLINYTALARIDPAKGVDSVKRDVTLDPGWTFTGTVLGPEGKPLAGARAYGLTDRGWYGEALPTTKFTVRAFNPRGPRDVLFQHLQKGLVGLAQPPKENGGSITVRMEPGAAVTGRLVDAGGQPRAGVELQVRFRPKKGPGWWDDYSPEPIKTDRQGRFRIQALLPGYQFHLSDGKGELPFGGALRSGQTKDLGDVQIKERNHDELAPGPRLDVAQEGE